MDDLELLRRFRSDIDEPDDEQQRAARARLVALMGEPTPRRMARPTRRRWAVAAIVGVGALALVVAMPALLPRHTPGGADDAAAAVLRRVAAVAATQSPEPVPQAGQYVYTKSFGAQTSVYVPGRGLADFSFTLSSTREAWIGVDGTGRLKTVVNEVTFPTARDKANWAAASSPSLNPDHNSDELTDLHFLDLRSLPSDADELRRLIEKREVVGGPRGDWETFTIVGDMLRETYTAPAVRAALYEVAANLPGVEYVGAMKDAAGREGIAVAYTHNGIRQQYIFDPQTSRLLGESQVIANPIRIDPSTSPGSIIAFAGEAGTVVYNAAYLGSGVVDSRNQTP